MCSSVHLESLESAAVNLNFKALKLFLLAFGIIITIDRFRGCALELAYKPIRSIGKNPTIGNSFSIKQFPGR
jgi:hypothetical protein